MDAIEPLDPTGPAVLGVLLDDDCRQVWECLRRLETGTDLATLAATCGVCVTETGRQVDRLVHVAEFLELHAQRRQRAPVARGKCYP